MMINQFGRLTLELKELEAEHNDETVRHCHERQFKCKIILLRFLLKIWARLISHSTSYWHRLLFQCTNIIYLFF